MKLTIRFTEVRGYPRMEVNGCVPEKGDGVRLLNWGHDRELDFRALCDVHKAATKECEEQQKVCTNRGRLHVWAWRELWKRVLEIRYGSELRTEAGADAGGTAGRADKGPDVAP